MWDWVQSLGREGPMDELMTTHSSILVCLESQHRGAWRATVHGLQRVRHNWVTYRHTTSIYFQVCQSTALVLFITLG